MNKYGSVCREFTMRGVTQSTIIPPNDYTFPITAGNGVQSWMYLRGANTDGNALLKNVSVNCNFADGLVWKNPYSRIRLSFGVSQGVIGKKQVGVVSGNENGYSMTGLGTFFLANVAPGQSIIVNNRLYIVNTVLSNTLLTVTTKIRQGFSLVSYITKGGLPVALSTFTPASKIITVDNVAGLNTTTFYYTSSKEELLYCDSIGILQFTAQDYPVNADSNAPLYEVYQPTGFSSGVVDISQLNVPVSLDQFAIPYLNGVEGADFLIIQTIIEPNGADIVFETKSVNTAFANSICHFDVSIEAEFTI